MVTKLIKICLLILVIFYSHKIFAQERKWILYYENDTSRYFYDSIAIHPHGGIIYVWEMNERVYEGWKGFGSEVLYYINRLELECSSMRFRIISSTIYHKDGTTTNIDQAGNFASPAPNSGKERLINMFCKSQ